MYEVFDSFCKLPTWDTSHALDERRFRAALSEVVHLPDFSPEEMGRYIQLNHAKHRIYALLTRPGFPPERPWRTLPQK